MAPSSTFYSLASSLSVCSFLWCNIPSTVHPYCFDGILDMIKLFHKQDVYLARLHDLNSPHLSAVFCPSAGHHG